MHTYFCEHTFYAFILYIDLLPNVDDSHDTESYVNEFVAKLVSFLTISNNRNQKVIDFMPPTDLIKVIDFNLPHERSSLGDVLRTVDTILKFVVKTGLEDKKFIYIFIFFNILRTIIVNYNLFTLALLNCDLLFV